MRRTYRSGYLTSTWVAVVSIALWIGLLVGSVRGASGRQDTARVFSSHTGLVFNYVKAAQAEAFETAMVRVSEALAVSEVLERRLQGASWKLYRVDEPIDGDVVLYVSILSPVVPGADYWVPEILNEAFPTQIQGFYDAYVGAFAAGQVLVSLDPVDVP